MNANESTQEEVNLADETQSSSIPSVPLEQQQYVITDANTTLKQEEESLTLSNCASTTTKIIVNSAPVDTSNCLFNFKMEGVWKVFQSGSLDYWVFGICLETNLPSFKRTADSLSSSSSLLDANMIQIHTGRRYKEFVFLRSALIAENPTLIVPPLPGMSTEGMLEKLDSFLNRSKAPQQAAHPSSAQLQEQQQQQEIASSSLSPAREVGVVATLPTSPVEVPALITFRMRSLELFLAAISASPKIRSLPLVQTFLESSPDELERFQQQWSKRELPASSLPSGFGGWMLRLKAKISNSPRSLDPVLLKAKVWAESMSAEIVVLKDMIEAMWDDIVIRRMYGESDIPEDAIIFEDPVLSALLKASSQVFRGSNFLSEQNEELFMSIVVDASFCCGLCDCFKQVIAHIEQLSAVEFQMAQSGQSGTKAFNDIAKQVEEAYEIFAHERQIFSKIWKPILSKIATNFADLSANLDPTNFGWRKRIDTIILSIPDW